MRTSSRKRPHTHALQYHDAACIRTSSDPENELQVHQLTGCFDWLGQDVACDLFGLEFHMSVCQRLLRRLIASGATDQWACTTSDAGRDPRSALAVAYSEYRRPRKLKDN